MAAEYAHLDVIKYLVTEQQVEPLCEGECDGIYYTAVVRVVVSTLSNS